MALEEVIGGQFPEEELDFVTDWMKTNYVKEELDKEGSKVGGNRDSDEEGADAGDRHSSPEYEPEEEQDKNNIFQCSYTKCQKTFLSKKFLWQHKSREHTKNKFTCDICAKSFKQSCNLKRHKKIHNKGDEKMKPFKELSEKQQVRRMQLAHEEALVKECQCNPEGKRTGHKSDTIEQQLQFELCKNQLAQPLDSLLMTVYNSSNHAMFNQISAAFHFAAR